MSKDDINNIGKMSESDKYKAFRNFMTNELGITSADIERWTKESVERTVEKKFGQINVEELQDSVVNRIAALHQVDFSNSREIKQRVISELTKGIQINVKKVY